MEHNKINPEKLRTARIARGLTIKELAEQAGISRQMVSNYELGKSYPRGKTLLSLIESLNFPLSYFTSEVKPMYRGATFFRSQSAATKKARDMQEVRLGFQKDIYDNFKQFVNFPKVVLPDILDKEVQEIDTETIKMKAAELRRIWEIPSNSPISNMIELAEYNGIIVSEANMSHETLDAVSTWIGDRPFIMLTDNNQSSVRRRFNVAHELGHIILHGGVESIDSYTSSELKKIIEYQANLFASYFLLPDEAFIQSLLSINLEFYVELKKYWKVSIQAMIFKTRYLELISEDQALYLYKKIGFNKWKKHEPLDDTIPIEQPTLFKKVFELIVDNGVRKEYEIVSDLKLPVDEIMKSLNIEELGYKRYERPKLTLL